MALEFYTSPLGKIGLMANAENQLTNLWFAGQKYAPEPAQNEPGGEKLPVLRQAERWLDAYFAGQAPQIDFALAPAGTVFQKQVWNLLRQIPYGQTVSYGQLAREAAALQGKSRMSAQAVGGAVGHNPIAILIPCHRVLGADGSLTGYAGGLERKRKLLELEKSR